MTKRIELKYVNDRINIGMVDVKEVYCLFPEITKLQPEVFRGKLVYRAKGSSQRVSYLQLKKGLVKRRLVIEVQVPDWL